MSLSAGTQLGPYEVVDLLGAGAMGEVYKARDTRLRRTVAVKVLPAALSEDAERLRRFEQEARAAGALNHPNIVAVHDMGTADGSPYVVSELLEGETLRERLLAGPLPLRKVLDYATQMARGLAAAHERGIVHRDLKPENVFVTRDGSVKILDFGLAKLAAGYESGRSSPEEALTRPGTVLGTVGYMSPEQVRGQATDHRSDIFSFGSILYEMLTGAKAFRGRSAVETMNAILREDPPDLNVSHPDLPPAVERIVSHCLEKNPDERFQSARDLAFDLYAVSHLSSVSGLRALPGARRRPRARTVLLVLAALVLPLLGYLAGRGAGQASSPVFHRLTFRRGTVGAARFAPDGQIVYSAAWDGAPREAFTVRPEAPDARSLGYHGASVVSVSTGGELGLLLSRPGRKLTLARAPLAGGPPREILEGVGSADALRDGSAFAILRHAEGRSRLEFPVGTVLYQTSAALSDVRIAPGGDRVALLEHPVLGDDRGLVVVVDREGHRTALTDVFASVHGLAWRPDGREVWFTGAGVGADSALFATTLSGRVRLVHRAPGRLVLGDVAPDGRVLLQRVAARMEVKLHHTDGTPDRDLSWLDYSAPTDISRDGTRMLFYESGQGAGAGYGIYLRGVDGSLPVRLGDGRAAALSPDGRLAVSIPLTGPPRLVLLPTGPGEARTLSDPGLERVDHAWFFPDGRRLLVLGAERGRRQRLFEVPLDGGRFRPLFAEGVVPSGGRPVSPDGLTVLAYPPESDGPLVYPVDGGDPRPIAGLKPEEGPVRWTEDGRRLYVRSGKVPVEVVRLDPVTGAREPWQKVVPADPAGVEGVISVIPTPDGRACVYTFHRSLSEVYLVDGLR